MSQKGLIKLIEKLLWGTAPLVYLPSREHLFITNEADPLDSYYGRFPLKQLMQHRLATILALMGNKIFPSVLEIGYGSGIFLPELSRRTTNHLIGIDTHSKTDLVHKTLELEGIANKVSLFMGSVTNLPFERGAFDAVIAVSVLEHIKDISIAIEEIRRIIKPRGSVFLGFPVDNIFLRLLAKINRWDYDTHHPTSHLEILKEVDSHFRIISLRRFPRGCPERLSLYICLEAVP